MGGGCRRPGVSAPAGRRRPTATWLATRASRRAALGRPAARPASSQVLGPEQVHKGTTPASDVSSWTQWVFYCVLSLVAPRCSGRGRTTLTPALSAAPRGWGGGGERPLQLCPPAHTLASFPPPGRGPLMGALCLLPGPPPPPHCLPRSLFPAPRAVLGLCPNVGGSWSGPGQSVGHYAKAAQEAPWVARWALTGPPPHPCPLQTLTCRLCPLQSRINSFLSSCLSSAPPTACPCLSGCWDRPLHITQ